MAGNTTSYSSSKWTSTGQQIEPDLWKGAVINWQFDSGAEFKVTAADGL